MSSAALAQQAATLEGLVVDRTGPNIVVQAKDHTRTTVVLSDATKATEKDGLFGWGHKNLGITELVPGLDVRVDGTYDQDHKLVARKVVFTHGSLRTAKQIEAGTNPVQQEVAKAQDELRSQRRDLDQNTSDIASAKQDIAANKSAIGQNTQDISSAKTAIGQTNGRIGQLDQYDTKDSLTITFANGRATVAPKYKQQIADFVKAAANTPGAMIEVQGFASKVGNAELNQRLSAERAEAVIALIQQTGEVPLTSILAPAAMGVTNPVSTAHSRSAQAQNRRVVVTIVVNKGISASSTTGM
jgi:outer membrane protein OmpA-like peptidoglycan-associated protein